MRARRCVGELSPIVFPLDDPRTLTWHILPTGWDEPEADWAPILCSATEGITLPGHYATTRPTCPDCIAAARSRLR